MANRFKDYRAQLKSNKTVVLSDEELKLYLKTANNEGVSHANIDWGNDVVDTKKYGGETGEDVSEVPDNSDKEKTIIRNMEREQKIKEIKTEGDME
jgi:hypothetical protein